MGPFWRISAPVATTAFFAYRRMAGPGGEKSDKQWAPGDVNSPFLQSTFTSATKFRKTKPSEASPSVTWKPLFIYISIGLPMFYSSHFHRVVMIFLSFPLLTSSLSTSFSHTGRNYCLSRRAWTDASAGCPCLRTDPSSRFLAKLKRTLPLHPV